MATPQMVSDGVSSWAASILGRFMGMDGSKIHGKSWKARIRYNGASWEVVSTVESWGLTSGALAWATDHLNVALSGFTNPPHVQVTPVIGTPIHWPKASAVSASQVQVEFYQNTAPGTRITTQDTNMDCMLSIEGT